MTSDDILKLTTMLTTIISAAAVLIVWLAVRHHHRLATIRARPMTPDGERAIALLSQDNERLVGQIGRLEERIAVLERIATDPAIRTHEAIELLR